MGEVSRSESPRASLGRYAVATLVAWLSASTLDFLINAVILGTDFKTTAGYWRPQAELQQLVPVGRLAFLVTVVAYGLIVRYLLRSVNLISGLALGGCLGLSAIAGVTLGMYSVVAWPPRMLIAWGLQGALNAVLIGAIFGVICRDRPALPLSPTGERAG
jgi:hypothetical protein